VPGTGLHMAIDFSRYRRNPLEVLEIWGNDDVYILCPADHPPSINGKTTD
jgi:hypothetical protein